MCDLFCNFYLFKRLNVPFEFIHCVERKDKKEKYCTNLLFYFYIADKGEGSVWAYTEFQTIFKLFSCLIFIYGTSSKSETFLKVSLPSTWFPRTIKVNPLAFVYLWRKINIWIPSSSFTEFTLHCFVTEEGSKELFFPSRAFAISHLFHSLAMQ